MSDYAAAEFREAVLRRRPRTAAFDCDGTLWAPDAGYGFMRWSLAQGLVAPAKRAWMEQRYELYEAGAVDEAEICGEMVQLYAGLRADQLGAAAEVYFRTQVAAQVFPEMAALVQALQAAGTEIWAVSSTGNWIVEAGVWDLGRSVFGIPPERILAARIAVDSDGVLTERLLAVPTGEAKAEALARAGIPHPEVAFGNSVHDAAMLKAAKLAFPVNASEALHTLARERGWRAFAPTVEGVVV